jgi:hypothetical protein
MALQFNPFTGTFDVTTKGDTGNVSAAGDGTAALPGITFASDPNTGIYRPGEDQVAISTGGSGRLFVDASGNVGVNAAPTYRFDVSNGGASAAAVRILGNDQSNVRLRLQNSGSGGRAYEIVGGSNAANNSHFTIYDATAAATRLAISDTGLVGVGTASPSQLLHVRGNALVTGSGGWTTNEEANIYLGDIYGSLSYDFNTTNLKTKSFGSTSFLTGGTSPTERLRITSTGQLQFKGAGTNGSPGTPAVSFNGSAPANSFVIDSSGRVGIGTTSPLCLIDGRAGADGNVMLLRGGSTRQLTFGTTSTNPYINADNGAGLEFQVNGSPRAVIDSSGRLLVGTSTARLNWFNGASLAPQVQIEGAGLGARLSIVRNDASANGHGLILGKTRGSSYEIVSAEDPVGYVSFQGADGAELVEAARIETVIDGTPGANDMPGRLVFSTTADGASSPTERMRIDNQGGVFINRTTGAIITSNERLSVVGAGTFQRASGTPLHVNRTIDDGNLLDFYQDTVIEGSISVSGNTISLNGAHLSRWSQLPKNGDRIQILRGTVLSNLDEMCDWGEQTNEQLNCMKVSDVEGDPNVAGVFQGWDDDDEVHTKDFYCAMTGDMIIRIAEGVTVQRGDLLMSAGDGTAKPQDDDIIRSKTIAKVTSTHVTCTYDDGSYCVPCVLMAC